MMYDMADACAILPRRRLGCGWAERVVNIIHLICRVLSQGGCQRTHSRGVAGWGVQHTRGSGAAMDTVPMMQSEACQHGRMEVLATGDEALLVRPCVDCGRRTGNFCETPAQAGHTGWEGGICLAAKHIPSEEWAPGQRTPLCSACEHIHGACHVCRRVSMCTPPSPPP